MAEQGKGGRSIIEELRDDIGKFVSIVSDEIVQMRSEASSLRGDWDDEKYEEFLSYIDSLALSIDKDLGDLEDVKRHLEIILDKMT